MSERKCFKHGTVMLESKFNEGEYYCPEKVGVNPNTDKAIYCDQTWKPGDTDTPAPPSPPVLDRNRPIDYSLPPPPPVQSNGEHVKNQRTALITAGQFLGGGAHNVDQLLAAADRLLAWLEDEDVPAKAAPLPGPADSLTRTGESKWHQCTDLINKARAEIPYYEDKPHHVVGALNKLEKEGTISWTSSSLQEVFDALNAYAHKRANEKASGG